jgi:hypothetical protein
MFFLLARFGRMLQFFLATMLTCPVFAREYFTLNLLSRVFRKSFRTLSRTNIDLNRSRKVKINHEWLSLIDFGSTHRESNGRCEEVEHYIHRTRLHISLHLFLSPMQEKKRTQFRRICKTAPKRQTKFKGRGSQIEDSYMIEQQLFCFFAWAVDSVSKGLDDLELKKNSSNVK